MTLIWHILAIGLDGYWWESFTDHALAERRFNEMNASAGWESVELIEGRTIQSKGLHEGASPSPTQTSESVVFVEADASPGSSMPHVQANFRVDGSVSFVRFVQLANEAIDKVYRVDAGARVRRLTLANHATTPG